MRGDLLVEVGEAVERTHAAEDLQRRRGRRLGCEHAVGQQAVDAIQHRGQLVERPAYGRLVGADRPRVVPRRRHAERAGDGRCRDARLAGDPRAQGRVPCQAPAQDPARHHLQLLVAPALGRLRAQAHRVGREERRVRAGARARGRSSREPWTRRPSSLSAGTVPPRKPTSRRCTRCVPGSTVASSYSMPLSSSIRRTAWAGCGEREPVEPRGDAADPTRRGYAGRVNAKRLSPSSVGATPISPPWRSTISRQIASPSPPPRARRSSGPRS